MSATKRSWTYMKSSTLTLECVNILFYYLERLGINKYDLITSAGIDPRCLNISHHRIAPEAFSRIFHKAVELTDDPYLGMHVGSEANLDALGLVGQLYRYSPDAISGAHKITQYLPLFHTSFYYGTKLDAQHFSIFYQPLEHSVQGAFGARQLIELTLAFNRRGIQYGTQKLVNPIAVHIGFPVTKSQQSIYEEILACPVIGNAPVSELIYDLQDVQGRHSFDNPTLLSGLETLAAVELARIRKEGAYCLTVKNCMINDLAENILPDLKYTAARIGISADMLRERIQLEGGTFKDILSKVYCEISNSTAETGEEQELMSKAIFQARKSERSRIARDLHDGISGMLSAAKMHLSTFQQNPQAIAELNKAIGLLDSASSEVRKTAHNLSPEMLHQYGLDLALQKYCEVVSSPQTTPVRYQSIGRISTFQENFELTIYRIVQELIHNAIKHAEAKEILVQISESGGLLTLTIEDDGNGFLVKNGESTNLPNIKQRIEAIGGRINWESNQGTGTSVYAEFETEDFIRHSY